MADEGACLCWEGLKLGEKARHLEERGQLESSLKLYDLAIGKATRAHQLWCKVSEQKNTQGPEAKKLTTCIEWARGFQMEQQLYRGLICGWLGKLDEAFDAFEAVATSTPCQVKSFQWVVGEAHICLGHTITKFQMSGETREDVNDFNEQAKVLDTILQAPCFCQGVTVS